MGDCCCSSNMGHDASECPMCGSIGQPAPHITVDSLVEDILIPPAEEFYICLAPDCEVVYFSRNKVIRQANVSVPVGWKNGSSPKYACYCNHVTEDQVINAVVDGGARTVGDVSRLTGAMKNGHCLVNNPKGRCCHTDIERLINHVLESGRLPNE